ncbi:hypothetical protein ACSS6W_011080 [Trichoderma asperelloides]
MTPIRVGLIGLSTADGFSGPGSWAASTHLPALMQSPEYEIVALANSTVESAQRSIAAHRLPPSTKPYGSATDIANDPNVDLIVVSVHVQKHFELARPALLQRKKVFVEWPLAANPSEIEELAELARSAGVQTCVGVQTRASPMIQKLKEIVSSGKIGRIINSSVVASSVRRSMDKWPENMKYYLDMSSGGNEFYIHFGHFLDSFIYVMGDIVHHQSILKTQYKTVQITGKGDKITDPKYPKSSPDHILLQGITDSGTVFSMSFRSPKSSADEKDIRWYISGTQGEIMVTAPAAWTLHDREPEIRLRIGDQPIIAVDFQEFRIPVAEKVPSIAVNVASMYNAFAQGDTSRYATFDSAVKTHRLLEDIKRTAFIG